MPKGVYERSPGHLKKLTAQVLRIKPEQMRGVSHGGKAPRGSEAFKQLLRDDRNRYSRTPKGRYQHLKSSAKLRGLELNLSLEEMEEVRAIAICFYCRGPLPQCGHGLDRLNSDKGYTKENVVACCSGCNRKKGRLEGIGFKFPRTVALMKELMQ
jgi:hypothetical protein